MAFSTQKDFFHVPFMNESVEYECGKACVKLKSYNSTTDDRAWALDDKKQSKFLSDLVACQTAAGEPCGDGRTVLSSTASRGTNETTISQMGPIGGDSLLECANTHLAEYQKVLNINSKLEKELEMSEERLKTAKEETKKIKEILTAKLDHNIAKDFSNKIQQMKLSQNEENELLQIHKKIEDIVKAYEVLQAENNYVKRLVEKLSARASISEIPTEPEVSTDITYLQNQVNNLRRECALLRKLEDDFQRLKQSTQREICAQKCVSDQDAENIRSIVKERNSLREKCRSFKALEKKVGDLQQKEQHLSANLSKQSKYITNMESEIQKMQKYYEEQQQQAAFREECLKAQLEEIKGELLCAKCQAQKADMLQMEVCCLRNEILKRDMALADYDCQYKQLMHVVDELQACCVRERTIDTDDLAFFAQATLNHIGRELRNRSRPLSREPENKLETKADEYQPRARQPITSGDECCLELEQLRKKLDECEKGRLKDANCDELCAEALDRLKKLEELNDRLKKDLENAKTENDRLQNSLRDCNTKMEQMLDKLNKLENELRRNAKDATEIGKDLQSTKELVRDISDMQVKNEQLASAVKAINSRDDEKIIDELRKQLDDVWNQLKKCQQNNDKLQRDLDEKEKELKDVNDLNNKLKADKDKLLTDMEKLKEERDKLATDKSKLEAERNKLSDDMEKLKKERDNLLDDKRKLEDENNKLASDIKKLEDEKNKLAADLKKLEDEKNNLLNDKKKLEDEKNKLVSDLKKLEDEKNKLTVDLKKLEDERNNLLNDKKKLEDEKNKLAADLKKLEDEKNKLEADLRKLEDERNNLLNDKKKLEDEKNKLAADLSKLENERDNLLNEKKKLEDEKNKLAADLKKLEDEKNKLISDMKKLEDERNKLFDDKKRLEDEKNKLTTDLKKLEDEKNKLAADLKKMEDERNKLAADLKRSEDEKNKLADDLKKLEAERNNLLNDKKRLEDEKNKLASELKKIEDEKNKLISDMKKLEDERDKLLTDKKKLEDERNKLGADLKKLNDEKGRLDAEMKKLGDEKNKLAANLTKLENEKNNLGAEMAKLKDEQHDRLQAKGDKAPQDAKTGATAPTGGTAPTEATAPVSDTAPTMAKIPTAAKAPTATKAPTGARAPAASLQPEKRIIKPKEEEQAIETFVQRSAEKFNIKGGSLEKELRKILDEFIQECSFCFCRLANPKSKLYTICHKTYHYGIHTLSFRELAYLHRKIFKQCELLLPGFLLNMILTDNAEQAKEMLANMVTATDDTQSGQGICGKGDGDSLPSQEQLKCCCCKSELCCMSSEENLKEKVIKLERDIEHAKDYLYSLKKSTPRATESIENDSSKDTPLTYRAIKFKKKSSKNHQSKKSILLNAS